MGGANWRYMGLFKCKHSIPKYTFRFRLLYQIKLFDIIHYSQSTKIVASLLAYYSIWETNFEKFLHSSDYCRSYMLLFTF